MAFDKTGLQPIGGQAKAGNVSNASGVVDIGDGTAISATDSD
jgi:hypothetical protein